MASSVLGVDDRIKKEGDEIRKVIGMKMGEQDVRDLVSIHTGFDQVHQSARTEIQYKMLIRAHKIASGRPRRVYIGSGTENGESHGQHTGSYGLRRIVTTGNLGQAGGFLEAPFVDDPSFTFV
jgi:hypothetical protein